MTERTPALRPYRVAQGCVLIKVHWWSINGGLKEINEWADTIKIVWTL